MSFVVEVTENATVRQGIKRTVKTGTSNSPAIESFDIRIKAGVAFTDKQLTKAGRFVDSDDFATQVRQKADYLASDAWTILFDFTPTFELVAKWLCDQLQADVKQLEYVEIENVSLGVTTQYIP